MADSLISALTAATSVAGTEMIPLETAGSTNRKITPDVLLAPASTSQYYAGRWYFPAGGQAGGTAIAANVVKFYPVPISKRITISDFGVRVVTGAASSHLLVGIYASNSTTGMPTGTALGSGVLDTSTSGTTPTITLGTNISLTPGLYWFASLSDGTATLNSVSSSPSGASPAAVIGSSSFANLSTASVSSNAGFFFNSTYAGGFPDMTSNTVSELGNSLTNPVIGFKVTSVP